ncbi:HNH endonuclease signature motif containing protein [Streptomyces sp. NPDC059063]|uniref:HNH endonuclease signature motif containing protein n=1 Tax=unclassified Streptomyces TaxID=2593676 RepID=UPI0036A82E05
MRPACSIEGCDRVAKARGWCGTHWWRWRHHGDPEYRTPERPAGCQVSGCGGARFATTYCQKHYTRQLRHGNLLGVRPREAAAVRFWLRVDRNAPGGCWLWTGARGDHGYGTLQGDDGRTVGAHRFSYTLHHGPIPDGLLVMHSCDNPPCANPAHLSVGTHADNMRDMAAKGRSRNQGRPTA